MACVATDEEICSAVDLEGVVFEAVQEWAGVREGWEFKLGSEGLGYYRTTSVAATPRAECTSAGGGGRCNYTAYEDEVLEKCEATVEHPRTGARGDMRVCGDNPAGNVCRGCSAYVPGSSVSCVTAGQGLPGGALNCIYSAINGSDTCVAKAAPACAAVDVGDPRVNSPGDKYRCETAGEEPGVCTYTPYLPTIDEACYASEQRNCSSAVVGRLNKTADTAACAAAGACTLWLSSRRACEFASSDAGACELQDTPRICRAADEAACADANVRRDTFAFSVEDEAVVQLEAAANESCQSAGQCVYTAAIPSAPQAMECDEMCGEGTQVDTTTYAACESCAAVGPRHISFDGTPCRVCEPGKQANPQRTECLDCSAGQYSDHGVFCRPCPGGWEPTTRLGAAACTPCAVNHYSAGDHCHRCVEDTVTQAVNGMVIASPDSAEDCRCPDGTYDSALPGGGTSHIYCWADGRHTALPWLEPSNLPSQQDIEGGKKCVACPDCVECDGGAPRLRAGYHVSSTAAGNASETLLLLDDELTGDRHVYRCPLPELCLGEVVAGCDTRDCTPLFYEAEHEWMPEHTHDQESPHATAPGLQASGLNGSRCELGFSGRFCLGQCVDGDAGARNCDSIKCGGPDWSAVYGCTVAALLLLVLLSACSVPLQTNHDARKTRCCTRDGPDPAAEQPQTRPRLVHGCCSTDSLRGCVVMVFKPVALVWPRLRLALMLLATLYQPLSSLPTVLALPLPQRAWSMIEFFAPFVNLDVTLFPSVGCGLGFYSVLWIRLLSVPALIVPAWLLWFARVNCNCLETRRAKQEAEDAVLQKLPRPHDAGDGWQDPSMLVTHSGRAMRAHNLLEATVAWTFFIVYLAHPGVTRSLLQLYDCRSLDDGSSHLVADVRIVCHNPREGDDVDPASSGSLDALYAMHLSVASVVLIVWCAVLPVLLTLRLWRARKSIAAGLKQPGLAPFYSHCKPSCYLWEVYSTLVSRAHLPLAPFLKMRRRFS